MVDIFSSIVTVLYKVLLLETMNLAAYFSWYDTLNYQNKVESNKSIFY